MLRRKSKNANATKSNRIFQLPKKIRIGPFDYTCRYASRKFLEGCDARCYNDRKLIAIANDIPSRQEIQASLWHEIMHGLMSVCQFHNLAGELSEQHKIPNYDGAAEVYKNSLEELLVGNMEMHIIGLFRDNPWIKKSLL